MNTATADRPVTLSAEVVRLRTALFKIQCEQLAIACATDMTRPAMREAAMETRNEIIAILATPMPVAPNEEAVEIRPQVLPVAEIDEIVIRGGNVHIERMSNDGWFMGVEAADGTYWQFWFGAKNRKSHVEFRHVETTPAKP